jgi:type III restriction enzyme
MKFSLFPFQETVTGKAIDALRLSMHEVDLVGADGDGQAVTLAAPTGAGKTVMSAAILETLLHGDGTAPGDGELTVVWLSDLPNVNEQTCRKIARASDRITDDQLVPVDNTFADAILAPNRIYFLNTQKLAVGNLLVDETETRSFTIWEVLDRTIRREPSKFVLVIDEAHRGMDRSGATDPRQPNSIVQKFILGTDEMAKSPTILGLSATPRQFDELIAGTGRTTRRVEADVDEVRRSGLIKEQIVVWRPRTAAGHSDFTLLQRAAQDLNNFRLRWARHTDSKGVPPVHPVLVVQVEDKTANSSTGTDIEHAIATIEEVLGPQHPDAYAHCFGDAPGALTFGLRQVRYLQPSDIDADPQVSVVFFKMSLSTGWDCPRAEVIMSFRVAEDDDYVAQLVGRMVRTPLAHRIDEDEVLNSVSLYLPKYDRKAVQDIIAKLRAGDPEHLPPIDAEEGDGLVDCDRDEDLYSEIAERAAQIPTYIIPRRQRMRPIARLERLAGALSDYEIRQTAPADMASELVGVLSARLTQRLNDDEFRETVERARRVGLDATTLSYLTGQTKTQTIEVTSTSRSIDRLYDQVGTRVGAGLHDKLWRHLRTQDPNLDGDTARLQVIAALGEDTVMTTVEDIARDRFEEWEAEHQDAIDALSETQRRAFDRLAEHADEPTERLLALPLTIRSRRNTKSTDWPQHLFVDNDGQFPDDLNSWEAAEVERMLDAKGTIAWVRNKSSQGWSLTIPYENEGVVTPLYPDFLFFRRTTDGVVVDIVDPHSIHIRDAPAKARGLASYAKKHRSRFGRIELVIYDDKTDRRQVLNLKSAATRNRVAGVSTAEHLADLFDLTGNT